jgi:hypothetical protein
MQKTLTGFSSKRYEKLKRTNARTHIEKSGWGPVPAGVSVWIAVPPFLVLQKSRNLTQ